MYDIRTAAKASSQLGAARDHAAEVLARGESAAGIADAARQVAYWEGYHEMLANVERLAEIADDGGVVGLRKQFALMAYLADKLAAGADDQRSGRDNDVRRARWDGARAAAGVARRAIERAADDTLAPAAS